MLIGQEQDAPAALPRPLEHRARVARGADDAAVLADERLDGRRRIDVGDGDDRRRRPSRRARCQQISSSSASAMSAIEQPAARSGRITFWCGAVRTSALSAMKCTPQKTMKSASGWLAQCCAEAQRVADEVGELDHLVALIVMAQDDERGCRARPSRRRCGGPSPGRRGRGTARAAADVRRARPSRPRSAPEGTTDPSASDSRPCRALEPLRELVKLFASYAEEKANAAPAIARRR